MFVDLNSALSWVEKLKRFNKKFDLSQISKALSLLDNPQNSFKTIHIGGTNGKGSTSEYCFEILKEKGLKVGLYTSPYVLKFNERIKTNQGMISDKDALRILNFLYDFNLKFMEKYETLTFFEVITIMAFIYFKEQNLDIAVIEVGLGGRLDATNVITPLASIITVIEKDHLDILGKTYKKIAIEKLGILKENTPLITGENKKHIIKLFKEKCLISNSKLHVVNNIRNIKTSFDGTSFTYKCEKYFTPLSGFFQALNASIAIEAMKSIGGYVTFTEEEIKKGISKAFIPGRMEFLKDGKIVLDGGHNPEAIEKAFLSLKEITDKKIVSLYACMKDKDYFTAIKHLDKYAYKCIFTEIDYSRALNGETLLNISQNKKNIHIKGVKNAFSFAINNLKQDEILLIHGSLYLVSEARILIKEVKC